MSTDARKPLPPVPPLKLYAAFSGGAIDLLDTDPEIMGRSMERIPLLYEGDITPDRPGNTAGKWDGVARLLAWDLMATRESVRRLVPDVNYAGWIVLNFETFEKSMNPATLAVMSHIVSCVQVERPRAKVAWYGHPRRFFYQHLSDDKTGEIERYIEVFTQMDWLGALAPHQYPVGEVVASKATQLVVPKSITADDATRAIRTQASLVDTLANREFVNTKVKQAVKVKRPVVWFLTPLKQAKSTNPETGEEKVDSTAGCYEPAQFAWWVDTMRAAGITDFAIWMHATPGEEDQVERVRRAMVDVVFPAFGV